MNNEIKKLILHYGSVSQASRAIGVCKSTISCWMRGKRNPSAINCYKIERATHGKFKAHEIRPDLIDEKGDIIL